MSKYLLIVFLVSQLCLGNEQKCEKALSACEEVIHAQDKAIDNLKKSVIVLKKELEQSKRTTPTWVLIIGGIATGIVISSVVRR